MTSTAKNVLLDENEIWLETFKFGRAFFYFILFGKLRTP